MDNNTKEKLDKLITLIQNKCDEDYVNEFCQDIFCYILENQNVNKKLYACQYLKEKFITSADNSTNDVFDKLCWNLISVLTACIQYIDTSVDSQIKKETNIIAVELLNEFIKICSPKEMFMVYSEGISNLSEINSFNDVNEIKNETLLFNQIFQFIYISKALLKALISIKSKRKHQFMKNAITVLNKGLKSLELLSKRYNQYYFDEINNESTQNNSLYQMNEKELLNELIDFYIESIDIFISILSKEIETIPENLYYEQYNIINALTNPKTEPEIEYYLICCFLFELCDYGLAYTFTGTDKNFNKININKYNNIINNYKLKDYILTKWFSKLTTVASDLSIDISKIYYINNYEKYKDLNFSEIDMDDNKINNELPFSFGGRSVLLSSFYELNNNPDNFKPIDSLSEHQVDSLLYKIFPKVLNKEFIFYSSFDYLNELMISKQDIGVVSHVISSFDYLKQIILKQSITLSNLKNVNDINSVNLLSILKSYVLLMVTVPYSIVRDKMYILLKEFINMLTEEAKYTFIMEVIQTSYTESIIVLGIVLYKDAINEAWIEEMYGTQEIKKKNKKSILFSSEILDIVKKTLFNIESPIYSSFNTDLTFMTNDKYNKPKEKIECYLDTYEGFWKKFEILFQSLNLYSYLFLRDNKEKLIQIWNNNFNDYVELHFLNPLKEKVEKWKHYIHEQEANKDHGHDHHHYHTSNPYNYIPDCPEFQLIMMENIIDQLFSLRKDFNNQYNE
ncbi:hypothetical protein BCR32DRAFT_267882 [Anaeromyces robustus]|uniref:Uncharacterized protein n=1 Tax=Anaeromyces robustus TaxID=1754192 RepID=A0A1Y1X8H7_9FUNG|nr:hypothetical protein BCR32DRAFT_267882 [Anaeromyces robustus]|eukprot:ORX82047.1 hypothetical protein BCR32DRAFT_267882 [Anaeromyces robustus]